MDQGQLNSKRQQEASEILKDAATSELFDHEYHAVISCVRSIRPALQYQEEKRRNAIRYLENAQKNRDLESIAFNLSEAKWLIDHLFDDI